MMSPLTATGAPCSSRFDISAKSPLTGGMGHSNSGGDFGISLKRCGIDGLIIKGRSGGPVYLSVDADGNIVINDARDFRGMKTEETRNTMVGRHGEGAQGRTGMGAVMGLKSRTVISSGAPGRE